MRDHDRLLLKLGGRLTHRDQPAIRAVREEEWVADGLWHGRDGGRPADAGIWSRPDPRLSVHCVHRDEPRAIRVDREVAGEAFAFGEVRSHVGPGGGAVGGPQQGVAPGRPTGVAEHRDRVQRETAHRDHGPGLHRRRVGLLRDEDQRRHDGDREQRGHDGQRARIALDGPRPRPPNRLANHLFAEFRRKGRVRKLVLEGRADAIPVAGAHEDTSCCCMLKRSLVTARWTRDLAAFGETLSTFPTSLSGRSI